MSEAVRPVACSPATAAAVAMIGLWPTERVKSAGAESTGKAASNPAARWPRRRKTHTMARMTAPLARLRQKSSAAIAPPRLAGNGDDAERGGTQGDGLKQAVHDGFLGLS